MPTKQSGRSYLNSADPAGSLLHNIVKTAQLSSMLLPCVVVTMCFTIEHDSWKKASCFYASSLLMCHVKLYGDRSGSTLAQLMACCLMAPSHYQSQCWLIICEVLWYSSDGNFTGNVQYKYPSYEFKNGSLKITAASLRDQWVKNEMTSLYQTGPHW